MLSQYVGMRFKQGTSPHRYEQRLRRGPPGGGKPEGRWFSLRSLFGSLQEERVQEADSVWRQQQAHQQHSCTLDECFQFYTKEEQVLHWGSAPWLGGGLVPFSGWVQC